MTEIQTPRFYAVRNVNVRAADHYINEETQAMAHQSWGPYPEVEIARRNLYIQMRTEADYLDRSAHGGDRAALIREAAERVADHQLNEINVVGLSWKVSTSSW